MCVYTVIASPSARLMQANLAMYCYMTWNGKITISQSHNKRKRKEEGKINETQWPSNAVPSPLQGWCVARSTPPCSAGRDTWPCGHTGSGSWQCTSLRNTPPSHPPHDTHHNAGGEENMCANITIKHQTITSDNVTEPRSRIMEQWYSYMSTAVYSYHSSIYISVYTSVARAFMLDSSLFLYWPDEEPFEMLSIKFLFRCVLVQPISAQCNRRKLKQAGFRWTFLAAICIN